MAFKAGGLVALHVRELKGSILVLLVVDLSLVSFYLCPVILAIKYFSNEITYNLSKKAS